MLCMETDQNILHTYLHSPLRLLVFVCMENDQLVKGPVPELGRTDRPSEDPTTLYLLALFFSENLPEPRGDLFGLF